MRLHIYPLKIHYLNNTNINRTRLVEATTQKSIQNTHLWHLCGEPYFCCFVIKLLLPMSGMSSCDFLDTGEGATYTWGERDGAWRQGKADFSFYQYKSVQDYIYTLCACCSSSVGASFSQLAFSVRSPKSRQRFQKGRFLFILQPKPRNSTFVIESGGVLILFLNITSMCLCVCVCVCVCMCILQ